MAATPSSSKTPTQDKKFRWKPADPSWHPAVKGLYNSLKSSPTFEELTEFDMHWARTIAEEHSDALYNRVEKNAAHLKFIFEGWKELGQTVATRKRLGIEAEKAVEASNTAAILATLAGSIVKGNSK